MTDLDADMLAAIAALHKGDIASIGEQSKGKAREDDLDDETLAFRLYAQEIGDVEQICADHRFALSLEAATRLDGAIVDELQAHEQQAAEDHDIALAVSRGRPVDRASTTTSRASSVPPPYASEATSGSSSSSSSSGSSPPCSPGPASPSRATAFGFTLGSDGEGSAAVECTSCLEDCPRENVFKATCDHLYCLDCVKDLVTLAMIDEGLFPPRCCHTPFPNALVQALLPHEDRQKFQLKAEEHATTDRLYCSRMTCSRFLGSATDTKIAVQCPDCHSETCQTCKSPWHGLFGVCGKSTDDEVATVLERELGCQRCPQCRRMVELNLGCNHITCLCDKEFCFVCNATWKTCDCPYWSEEMLVIEEERLALAEEPVEAPPIPVAERVQRVLNRRQRQDLCTHPKWSFRPGEGHCRHCRNRLDQYLFRCRECETLACNRCRRNRL